MSEVRLNFLNWRPALEDTEHDGLTIADNVIHEPEGYKAVHLESGGSFATTGGLAASVATVLSVQAKPVGNQDDLFTAWISGGATPTLHVGINGVTATAVTTGYPLSFAALETYHEITAFDVCEYAGKIFFVVEASDEGFSNTITSLSFLGYMDY